VLGIAAAVDPEDTIQQHARRGGRSGIESAFGIDPGAILAAPRGLAEQGQQKRRTAGGFGAADFAQSAAGDAAFHEPVNGGNAGNKPRQIRPWTDRERKIEAGFNLGAELENSRLHFRLLFALTLLLQILRVRARAGQDADSVVLAV
jgi:hypothetical protein